MKVMKVECNYHCAEEEVYQRIDNLLIGLQEKYNNIIKNFLREWNSLHDNMNFSLGIFGFNLTGNVYIQEDKVILEGKVPLVAKPFQKKAEGIIKRELEELLA